MALDHSLTYTQWRLKNVPHFLRLKEIIKQVSLIRSELSVKSDELKYADFGCSNGFITGKITEKLGASGAHGFDFSEENLSLARRNHPSISFHKIDLNGDAGLTKKFDFVTCFETLEHVGNIGSAVSNVVGSIKDGGVGLIVVPIEHGPIGLMKCLIKFGYRYNLSELNTAHKSVSRRSYVGRIFSNQRMSYFRDVNKLRWGTHFGFDYRDVNDALDRTQCHYSSRRIGFNMFYKIHVT